MFAPADKATACGMWSTDYIIALVVTLTLVVVGLVLSRKMNAKSVRIVLIAMAVFASVTEVIKMIFVGVTYGIEKVEFVPLYFCSLFIYCSAFAASNIKVLKTAGLSFLSFGGIIGATAFFVFPNACIPNYPIYHFMCLRTMLFHGAMIYTGFLILITGYYKPQIKHFYYYLVTLLVVCLGAYLMNTFTGSDLMYISKPLPFELSKIVYNAVPHLYPFIIMVLEILVPFWVSYLIYFIIDKIVIKVKNNKKTNIEGDK